MQSITQTEGIYFRSSLLRKATTGLCDVKRELRKKKENKENLLVVKNKENKNYFGFIMMSFISIYVAIIFFTMKNSIY